jgi:hypothetical protein
MLPMVDREKCLWVGMDDHVAKPAQRSKSAEVLKGVAIKLSKLGYLEDFIDYYAITSKHGRGSRHN